ncbi:hypothetical protein V2J09_024034 [Rumex salicifolius]
MSVVSLFFLLFSALINYSNVLFCHGAELSASTSINQRIGINYGTEGTNLLSPYRSIKLIQAMNVGSVKLYNANPEILKLLAGTELRVSIMVQNDEIPLLASNASMASQWIRHHFLPYYPQTQIRTIMVGNEVFSNYNAEQWNGLVPAMRFIRNYLRKRNIHDVKVGSPLGMEILNTTFPPSNATFRQDLLPTIASLLYFLNSINSFFYVNVYPYRPWSANPMNISLDFALLRGGHLTYKDPGSGLLYTNLLDQMIDSVFFAIEKLGFRNVPIAIAETGWPNRGDVDEPGANVYNAATYNRNLVRKMMKDPLLGTPARPGTVIPTFIFSLYDENLRDGPGTERHWGILHPDGAPIYDIDLTGTKFHYGDALPAADNDRPYGGEIWCVVARGADLRALGMAVKSACGRLNGTCEQALAPGKMCYEPVSVERHANFAFSAYWARFRKYGAHCNFNGLATQTTRNPGHGTCKFPSVTL